MKTFFKKILRVIVRSAIYAYCKVVYRLKVTGKENILKEGPVIYCGNHRTYLDPPLIVITARRHVRFLAKEELKKNPLFAFLGVVFEGIYVKRDNKDISALKTTLKALKNGECVALFPEGTRNGLEKGEDVKEGAAFFALKTGAKVQPVGIYGGEKPFKKVYVNYGKPMDYSEYASKNPDKETLEKVSKDIMDNIIKLTKEPQ
ncbi:MAG TPA: 1-acyl-sn-glycerol-3-phosphate acyltransferase [Candidatus Merdicola faecigallinarum]|uniref:1-acyl-sn-glycerol-3-phosphate acyltransferase n=1 Tax=Candidatus Merdicola faecigallinarum TaxID=2840862 RepID=A0A9D1S8Z9_9FIRM|nr:1-acyl-sn-glycerol-3-phosphate acyltransferase [Candidatus Merdicola faecigallinarum]